MGNCADEQGQLIRCKILADAQRTMGMSFRGGLRSVLVEGGMAGLFWKRHWEQSLVLSFIMYIIDLAQSEIYALCVIFNN